jgi:hypothetical protein
MGKIRQKDNHYYRQTSRRTDIKSLSLVSKISMKTSMTLFVGLEAMDGLLTMWATSNGFVEVNR